jgi:ABC-type glutathione transport system ATPase component
MNESREPSADSILLRICGLEKQYSRRVGWRSHNYVALRGIDLTVRRGTILGILGRSGSGKTTLARCIAGMERPNAGSIHCGVHDLVKSRQPRPEIQLIFQDPSTALNPRFTAEELIAEPLVIQRLGTSAAQSEVVARLMNEVGLSPDWRQRRPREFSGGQLQRIVIARALAAEPRLLILDEAFTGLDLSTSAQIANLLLEFRSRYGLTYIFISHDLSLTARFCEEVAVMENGAIVESGPLAEVLSAPRSEATKKLILPSAAMERGLTMAIEGGS